MPAQKRTLSNTCTHAVIDIVPHTHDGTGTLSNIYTHIQAQTHNYTNLCPHTHAGTDTSTVPHSVKHAHTGVDTA